MPLEFFRESDYLRTEGKKELYGQSQNGRGVAVGVGVRVRVGVGVGVPVTGRTRKLATV